MFLNAEWGTVSICTLIRFVTVNKDTNCTLTCPIYIRHICVLDITTESTSRNSFTEKMEAVCYSEALVHLTIKWYRTRKMISFLKREILPGCLKFWQFRNLLHSWRPYRRSFTVFRKEFIRSVYCQNCYWCVFSLRNDGLSVKDCVVLGMYWIAHWNG